MKTSWERGRDGAAVRGWEVSCWSGSGHDEAGAGCSLEQFLAGNSLQGTIGGIFGAEILKEALTAAKATNAFVAELYAIPDDPALESVPSGAKRGKKLRGIDSREAVQVGGRVCALRGPRDFVVLDDRAAIVDRSENHAALRTPLDLRLYSVHALGSRIFFEVVMDGFPIFVLRYEYGQGFTGRSHFHFEPSRDERKIARLTSAVGAAFPDRAGTVLGALAPWTSTSDLDGCSFCGRAREFDVHCVVAPRRGPFRVEALAHVHEDGEHAICAACARVVDARFRPPAGTPTSDMLLAEIARALGSDGAPLDGEILADVQKAVPHEARCTLCRKTGLCVEAKVAVCGTCAARVVAALGATPGRRLA